MGTKTVDETGVKTDEHKTDGRARTAVYPASQRAGRSRADAGRARYTWTTSRPARAPVLRTRTRTVRPSPARVTGGTVSSSYRHVV